MWRMGFKLRYLLTALICVIGDFGVMDHRSLSRLGLSNMELQHQKRNLHLTGWIFWSKTFHLK